MCQAFGCGFWLVPLAGMVIRGSGPKHMSELCTPGQPLVSLPLIWSIICPFGALPSLPCRRTRMGALLADHAAPIAGFL